MADGQWMYFDHDNETHKTRYMRILENGVIQMRETIPMWLAQQLFDQNHARAAEFNANGKWAGHRNGATIAAVPTHLDNHFKELSGFDPVKGGEYDRDKYNSFLDDSDYRHLRTGGGKIGKRKAMV